MKELSIEEKANAYDKVRKKIALRFGSNVAEDIFSEFEISEDEEIRKAIINIFATHKDYEVYFGVSVKDIRVWLEKQSKQKPTDMSIKEKAHQIAWETSKHYDPLLSKESWCEMAALDMASWLEKRYKDSYFLTPEESLGISSEKYNEIVDECIFSDQKQVDGFDAELNALLKKYEHLSKEEVAECLSFYLGVVKGEQSKLTEEDEEQLQHCCGAVAAADYYPLEDKEEMENWLKSLKQRIGGQQ